MYFSIFKTILLVFCSVFLTLHLKITSIFRTLATVKNISKPTKLRSFKSNIAPFKKNELQLDLVFNSVSRAELGQGWEEQWGSTLQSVLCSPGDALRACRPPPAVNGTLVSRRVGVFSICLTLKVSQARSMARSICFCGGSYTYSRARITFRPQSS